MNATVAHWRELPTPDGVGGQATTWTQLGELRARLPQPSTNRATEGIEADADGTDLTQVVYVPPEADVRRGDELRTSTQTLKVIAAARPSVPAYLRLDCRARQ